VVGGAEVFMVPVVFGLLGLLLSTGDGNWSGSRIAM